MTSAGRTQPRGRVATTTVALVSLAVLYGAAVAAENFVDPDVYHGMALFREALRDGRIPLEDRFAYTPTIQPSVHHEWGMGAVLYGASIGLGSAGLLGLKYALAAGLAFVVARCARRRGASWPVFCCLAPAGILMAASGFSTLRAQVVTLVFAAVLLDALDRDRQGRRAWIAPWLACHTIWLNLHGGFVVGGLFVLLHAVEQRVRRAPVKHLALVLLAMAALSLVNPYGWRYVPAIAQALALDRSLVTEWDPLWRDAPPLVAAFAVSLAIVAYAVLRAGWRNAPGVLVLAAAATAALLHQRHLSIYAVAWSCWAPGIVEATPLGDVLRGLWTRRAVLWLPAWLAVGLASAVVLVRERPWHLVVPAQRGDHASLFYPVGAVQYLEEQAFAGNLMVPFTVGAFVSWNLHPRVKVSLDSRYEAAYPPDAAVLNRDFYAARGDWRRTLARHPTDAVLVPSRSDIAAPLEHLEGWSWVYRDDEYLVVARVGANLQRVDRRGRQLSGAFP